jgi:hypothetical protein
MNVFEENNYHFYEVSSAVAQYAIREENEVLEADEMCFRHLNKKSKKKFPALKTPSNFTSRHAIAVIRVQNMFRKMLGQIRARAKRRDIHKIEPLSSPQNDENMLAP